MITISSWRVLAVLVGLLGALAACTGNGARQDTGGASYDNAQSRPARDAGGGGGGY